MQMAPDLIQRQKRDAVLSWLTRQAVHLLQRLPDAPALPGRLMDFGRVVWAHDSSNAAAALRALQQVQALTVRDADPLIAAILEHAGDLLGERGRWEGTASAAGRLAAAGHRDSVGDRRRSVAGERAPSGGSNAASGGARRCPKYAGPAGFANGLYNAGALIAGRPAMLVEGALDALTIEQEAGDLVTPVATGATGGARRMHWVAIGPQKEHHGLLTYGLPSPSTSWMTGIHALIGMCWGHFSSHSPHWTHTAARGSWSRMPCSVKANANQP